MKKVFISYKYDDEDVAELPVYEDSTVSRNYVDWTVDNVLFDGIIYKGEHNGEDLSDKSDDYIWRHLKDKLYDSSVTVVLISPNMRDCDVPDREQWIPWEISYSLRIEERKERDSDKNALLAVILPDSDGKYGYYSVDNLFDILKSNIENGYTEVVKWSKFCATPEECIDDAIARKESFSGDPDVNLD